jgi:hypothetical protein
MDFRTVAVAAMEHEDRSRALFRQEPFEIRRLASFGLSKLRAFPASQRTG